MRPRKVRQVLLSMLVGALIVLGLFAIFKVRANADPGASGEYYGQTHAVAICSTLEQYPTIEGVLGVVEGVAQDADLSLPDAGYVIGKVVVNNCGQEWYILQKFIDWAHSNPQYQQKATQVV